MISSNQFKDQRFKVTYYRMLPKTPLQKIHILLCHFEEAYGATHKNSCCSSSFLQISFNKIGKNCRKEQWNIILFCRSKRIKAADVV